MFVFFVILYVLTGVIRFAHDFANRDVFSAPYVKRPRLPIVLASILLWPLPSVQRLIDNRRRIHVKSFYSFYLVPLFWGSWAYAASMLGFSTIFDSDSALPVKIIKSVGMLVIFGALMWWLFRRNRKKLENQAGLSSKGDENYNGCS